jgi:hypothetical protein
VPASAESSLTTPSSESRCRTRCRGHSTRPVQACGATLTGGAAWAAQVAAARRNGLGEEAIDLLRAKADPSKFPAEEAAIVTYVRQLMRTNRADQAAFDALHKKHGTKWLVELPAGAHYYPMLCGVVNAFEVAAPPNGDKLPA